MHLGHLYPAPGISHLHVTQHYTRLEPICDSISSLLLLAGSCKLEVDIVFCASRTNEREVCEMLYYILPQTPQTPVIRTQI